MSPKSLFGLGRKGLLGLAIAGLVLGLLPAGPLWSAQSDQHFFMSNWESRLNSAKSPAWQTTMKQKLKELKKQMAARWADKKMSANDGSPDDQAGIDPVSPPTDPNPELPPTDPNPELPPTDPNPVTPPIDPEPVTPPTDPNPELPSGGGADPGPVVANMIPNSSAEQLDGSGWPLGWYTGQWGENSPRFSHQTDGYQGGRALRVDMDAYQNGDAKWYFGDVQVVGGSWYKFWNYYRSNAPSNMTVRYLHESGDYSYAGLSVLSASPEWSRQEAVFQVPTGVLSLTIFHTLAAVGYLLTDDYYLAPGSAASGPVPAGTAFSQGLVSLSFDDSWISQYDQAFPILTDRGLAGTFFVETVDALALASPLFFHPVQILEMESRGMEIGAHSRTHLSLPGLSDEQLVDEIFGSKQDIMNMGVSQVSSFAYPYGDYDQRVIQAVKDAGFIGARGVERGFNYRNTDKYRLKIQEMNVNTTWTETKIWIDKANIDQSWLILMFHHIDEKRDQYSTTPDQLAQIADYLDSSQTKVITIKQGLGLMD